MKFWPRIIPSHIFPFHTALPSKDSFLRKQWKFVLPILTITRNRQPIEPFCPWVWNGRDLGHVHDRDHALDHAPDSGQLRRSVSRPKTIIRANKKYRPSTCSCHPAADSFPDSCGCIRHARGGRRTRHKFHHPRSIYWRLHIL